MLPITSSSLLFVLSLLAQTTSAHRNLPRHAHAQHHQLEERLQPITATTTVVVQMTQTQTVWVQPTDQVAFGGGGGGASAASGSGSGSVSRSAQGSSSLAVAASSSTVKATASSIIAAASGKASSSSAVSSSRSSSPSSSSATPLTLYTSSATVGVQSVGSPSSSPSSSHAAGATTKSSSAISSSAATSSHLTSTASHAASTALQVDSLSSSRASSSSRTTNTAKSSSLAPIVTSASANKSSSAAASITVAEVSSSKSSASTLKSSSVQSSASTSAAISSASAHSSSNSSASSSATSSITHPASASASTILSSTSKSVNASSALTAQDVSSSARSSSKSAASVSASVTASSTAKASVTLSAVSASKNATSSVVSSSASSLSAKASATVSSVSASKNASSSAASSTHSSISPSTTASASYNVSSVSTKSASSSASSATNATSTLSITSTNGTATATSTSASSTSTLEALGSTLMNAYYPDWSGSYLTPEDVDWSKFDVIDFAFALPTSDYGLEFTQDDSADLLTRLVSTGHAAGKRVKLSIGGWTGSTYFSTICKSSANRKTFIKNIVAAYDLYNLDGIDIDWEYPGTTGADGNAVSSSDSANFLTFLTELRAALPDGALISTAVQVWPFADSNGNPMTDVSGFAAVIDWILIMNYDVWGSSTTPGANAPLSDGCSNSSQPLANAYAAVSSWTTAGMPANQITLGVPAYGYLQKSTATSLKDRRSYPALPHKRAFSTPRSSSVTVYNDDGGSSDGQVMFESLISQGALKLSGGSYIGSGGFTREWDSCSSTPWLRSSASGQIITYDDPESMSLKGQFAVQAGLRGCNVFSIDGDWTGSSWPLTDAVRSGLSL